MTRDVRPIRFLRVVPPLLLTCALSFSGCSMLWGSDTPTTSEADDSSEPEAPAKELGAAEKVTSQAPEGELFRVAQRLFHSKMFTLARQSFQTLHDQYPMGAYAAYSEIKLADTYFYGNEFNEAAKRYEEFARSYPASSDLPYVKLQAARSLVLASKGGGRDRGPHEKALTLLESIIEQYPNTAYAAIADKERLRVVEELSSYDRMIIDFYERRENTAAVEARQKQFNQRWKAALTPKVSSRVLLDEAMTPLTLARRDIRPARIESSAEGITNEPSGSVSIPEIAENQNSPRLETPFADENSPTRDETGLALAALKPSTPLDEGATPPSAPLALSNPPTGDTHTTIVLQKVQCRDNGQPYVMLEFAKEVREVPPSLTQAPIEPVDGYVTLPGLFIRSVQPVFDCFAEGDLRVTDEHLLQLESDTPITVTTLANPPRLMLIPG